MKFKEVIQYALLAILGVILFFLANWGWYFIFIDKVQ